MDKQTLLALVNAVVVTVLCLTVHEFAHALMARWLGDDTAERMGRLSLDPTHHIDFVGTILLPAMGALSGLPIIGWAKPVPTSSVNYTRRFFGRRISTRAGEALVAAAGPLSNLLIALVLAVGLGLALRSGASNEALKHLFWSVISINMGLMVFNLIPVPPLDGSWILTWVLPERLRRGYQSMAAYAGLGLMLVVFFAGSLLSPLMAPARQLAVWVVSFAAGL